MTIFAESAVSILASSSYVLPNKVAPYLPTLANSLARNGETVLADVLRTARVEVEEATEFDNWDGGITGHTVHLQVGRDVFERIDLEHLGDLEKRTAEMLRGVIRASKEYIAEVMIKLDEDAVLSPPDSVLQRDRYSNIWADGPDYFRLFISHKAKDKRLATHLKYSCTLVGISCFVAHEDIRPTAEWESEILNALRSMDGLVALLTDSFHNSEWTDQEVGFALGREVPVLPVKLGLDPYGFIRKYQAIPHSSGGAPELSDAIVTALLSSKCDRARRSMESALVARFERSESFKHAERLFKLLANLDALPSDLIDRLKAAPEDNWQVGQCYALEKRLPELIQRLRGADSGG